MKLGSDHWLFRLLGLEKFPGYWVARYADFLMGLALPEEGGDFGA